LRKLAQSFSDAPTAMFSFSDENVDFSN